MTETTTTTTPTQTTTPPPKTTTTNTLPNLPQNEVEHLSTLLHSFTLRHQSHHRPIALITSGGTATDLEVNSVRFLDNFSTGLRGAVSVEQFLKRGYAVIHLWRVGSASPYARVLSGLLGVKQANFGLDYDCVGRLFGDGEDDGGEGEDVIMEYEEEDPWLTTSKQSDTQKHDTRLSSNTSNNNNKEAIQLHRQILNSTLLQRTLRERNTVQKQGLLLTIPFRTVDDYLAKLQLCTESIRSSQSLGIVYLAAAVSDFYVPKQERSLHKIQSKDYNLSSSSSSSTEEGVKQTKIDTDNCLTLKLHPVPKCIPTLRSTWCPDAYVVSFKLETDKTILHDKAKIAMMNNKVHVVIGNVLKTRHEKVWIMRRTKSCGVTTTGGDDGNNDGLDERKHEKDEFEFKEITKSGNGSNGSTIMDTLLGPRKNKLSSTATSIDEFEDATINYIVQCHFEYIANHFPGTDASSPSSVSGTYQESIQKQKQNLLSKEAAIQKELYWKKVKELSLSVAGSVLGMILSYGISSYLQQRIYSAGAGVGGQQRRRM
uniref:DNA/pantothenate metabolism flavoprotein C-terminal domain-containing protein n=1 Tax=Ditylum brightwellii TaxID=49249 RepID=A0A7S4RH47_9STRA|mmetsp:Transcript_5965/g.7742  ORF Transcript_5965/g.7742 Transcript_5965/m.7742 type:complete len:541 (+) Transcript_5965:77-1699(+)